MHLLRFGKSRQPFYRPDVREPINNSKAVLVCSRRSSSARPIKARGTGRPADQSETSASHSGAPPRQTALVLVYSSLRAPRWNPAQSHGSHRATRHRPRLATETLTLSSLLLLAMLLLLFLMCIRKRASMLKDVLLRRRTDGPRAIRPCLGLGVTMSK